MVKTSDITGSIMLEHETLRVGRAAEDKNISVDIRRQVAYILHALTLQAHKQDSQLMALYLLHC